MSPLRIVDLPQEVIEGTLVLLPLRDITSAAQTCLRFRHVVYHSGAHLWRTLFLQTFDDPRLAGTYMSSAYGNNTGWGCPPQFVFGQDQHPSRSASLKYPWKSEFQQRIVAQKILLAPNTPPPSTHVHPEERLRALRVINDMVLAAITIPPSVLERSRDLQFVEDLLATMDLDDRPNRYRLYTPFVGPQSQSRSPIPSYSSGSRYGNEPTEPALLGSASTTAAASHLSWAYIDTSSTTTARASGDDATIQFGAGQRIPISGREGALATALAPRPSLSTPPPTDRTPYQQRFVPVSSDETEPPASCLPSGDEKTDPRFVLPNNADGPTSSLFPREDVLDHFERVLRARLRLLRGYSDNTKGIISANAKWCAPQRSQNASSSFEHSVSLAPSVAPQSNADPSLPGSVPAAAQPSGLGDDENDSSIVGTFHTESAGSSTAMTTASAGSPTHSQPALGSPGTSLPPLSQFQIPPLASGSASRSFLRGPESTRGQFILNTHGAWQDLRLHARSRVYDLRRYTPSNKYGPLERDDLHIPATTTTPSSSQNQEHAEGPTMDLSSEDAWPAQFPGSSPPFEDPAPVLRPDATTIHCGVPRAADNAQGASGSQQSRELVAARAAAGGSEGSVTGTSSMPGFRARRTDDIAASASSQSDKLTGSSTADAETEAETDEGADHIDRVRAVTPTSDSGSELDYDYLRDGLRVDWEQMDAVLVNVNMNIYDHIDHDRATCPLILGPYGFESTRMYSAPGCESHTRDWAPDGDWAGIAGNWSRLLSFCDFRDLQAYNEHLAAYAANPIGAAATLPSPSLIFTRQDFTEAVHVLPVTLRISRIHDKSSCVPEFPNRPMLSIKGETSYNGAQVNQIAGTVRMTHDGTIRWEFKVLIDGRARWSSIGVQIGEAGSARGVVGVWTGETHQYDDPCGPFWFWKVA